jgi:hypothetical protein
MVGDHPLYQDASGAGISIKEGQEKKRIQAFTLLCSFSPVFLL